MNLRDYLYLITTTILACAVIVILVGCKSSPSSKCIANARNRAMYHDRMGYKVRMGSGIVRYNGMHDSKNYNKDIGGIRHRWCEYWDGTNWILARDTVKGYGGWPIEDYGNTYEPLRYISYRS